MTKSLMNKCKSLEVCTDRCKSESDMDCINKCGTQYLKDLHVDFDQRLKRYSTDVERM